MKAKHITQIVAGIVGLAGIVISAKPFYQTLHKEVYFPKVVPVERVLSERWKSKDELTTKIEIYPYQLLENNESQINHYRELAAKLEGTRDKYKELLQDEETRVQCKSLESVENRRNLGFFVATLGLGTSIGLLNLVKEGY